MSAALAAVPLKVASVLFTAPTPPSGQYDRYLNARVLSLDATHVLVWWMENTDPGFLATSTLRAVVMDVSNPLAPVAGPLAAVYSATDRSDFLGEVVPGTNLILFSDCPNSFGSAAVIGCTWNSSTLVLTTGTAKSVGNGAQTLYPPNVCPVSSTRVFIFSTDLNSGSRQLRWELWSVNATGLDTRLTLGAWPDPSPHSGGNVIWDAVPVQTGVALAVLADPSGSGVMPFIRNADDSVTVGALVTDMQQAFVNGGTPSIRADASGRFATTRPSNGHFLLASVDPATGNITVIDLGICQGPGTSTSGMNGGIPIANGLWVTGANRCIWTDAVSTSMCGPSGSIFAGSTFGLGNRYVAQIGSTRYVTSAFASNNQFLTFYVGEITSYMETVNPTVSFAVYADLNRLVLPGAGGSGLLWGGAF